VRGSPFTRGRVLRVLPLRLHALSKCRPTLGSLQQLLRCGRLSALQCSVCEQRAGRCRREHDESHAGSALRRHLLLLFAEWKPRRGEECDTAKHRGDAAMVRAVRLRRVAARMPPKAILDGAPTWSNSVGAAVELHMTVSDSIWTDTLQSGIIRWQAVSFCSSCRPAAAAAAVPVAAAAAAAAGAAAPRAWQWPGPCGAPSPPPHGCSAGRDGSKISWQDSWSQDS